MCYAKAMSKFFQTNLEHRYIFLRVLLFDNVV